MSEKTHPIAILNVLLGALRVDTGRASVILPAGHNCYKCGARPVAAGYTVYCEACLWELTEEMVAGAAADTAKLCGCCGFEGCAWQAESERAEAAADRADLQRDYLNSVMPRGKL